MAILRGHTAEVQSCEWNHLNKQRALSASNDGTVKLWVISAVSQVMQPIGSFLHDNIANQAIWHPTHDAIFASAASDQMCRIWDLRTGKDVKRIHAHTNDVLCCDFNKYENFIATGSTDNLIKVFDLRASMDQPLMVLMGHQLAVKRIKFSPYHANILASASYDMSVKVWDCNVQRHINQFEQHSEFATAVDFSNFAEGLMLSAGWDGLCCVHNINETKQAVMAAR